MIRLRQVAIIADNLDPIVDSLQRAFSVPVCFRDPEVSLFGLRNAVLLVGDQFIEALSPVREDTAVGRLLAKRGGPGGYMVIYEVDDLDDRNRHLERHGVRIVWTADLPDIRARHLHPRDVGGAIVSIDEPSPAGSWRWGGPQWPEMAKADTEAAVDGISNVSVASPRPEALAARWRTLGVDESVTFIAGDGHRVDGLVHVDLRAVDRQRVGETHDIGGIRFRLV